MKANQGIGVGAGLAAGVGIGAWIDDIGVGIGIGLALGIALSLAFGREDAWGSGSGLRWGLRCRWRSDARTIERHGHGPPAMTT
ncbi:hypothetical protein [Variovorax paradoxus]|uniref:hypothetical protein n=1 Tax=Variovorax paradoxus TaxID=34073 RepID=UPI001ABC048A